MTAFFAAPEWLVLLPAVGFAAWQWRDLGLLQPLRLACLLLLVLALAELRLPRGGRGLDLWVLVDRSASAAALIEPRRREIEALLSTSKAPEDALHFVDFADGASVRADTASETFAAPTSQTRTADAIHVALARVATDRAARLLLLTDGFSTEPLSGVGERLARQGVPLDLRLFTPAIDEDFRADALALPPRVQVGEPFLIELRVSGTANADVPLTVSRDGVVVARTNAPLRGGGAVVRFTDRIERGGAYRYTARLLPRHDPFPGNDEAAAWVEVLGGPRVLAVSSYTGNPLAAALRAQGFEVESVTELSRLSLGRLAGARAVVLDNVPAYRLPADFLDGLDAFVRVQGGGLLMTGGRFSFGAGGYFGSRIDGLLPVSMELRQEHRKLSVAMAIVMDRSGSMGVAVGGVTKMDLANEGAARSIELLGAHDAVAVFAVDSEAHRVVGLGLLGPHRAAVVDAVRRIQSGGGGIFVYNGLKAAWAELKAAPHGQKHVVLFADAADAEEPGEYEELLQEMLSGGATVSVIGLGTEADSDAALLKDIAARGKGRIFFNADPTALPALFTQETVAVARSAFLTDPVEVRATAGWLEISARPIEGLGSVDAYNLSYLRPEATAAALAKDEYAAPLVAYWQRGPGRAAAVSFPTAGEHSERVRAWPRYGDFLQTLTRWLVGEATPPGVGLRARLDGTRLGVDLLFDDGWQHRVAASPPEILVAEGVSGQIRPLVWERLRPGHLTASLGLTPGQVYRGGVRIGAITLPFGPVVAPGGAEWSFDRARLSELKALMTLSGGRERTDLSEVWKDAPRIAPMALRRWLLAAFLLAFLADALRARLGYRWGWVSGRRSVRLAKGADARGASREALPSPIQGETPTPAGPVDEPPPPAERAEAERRSRRFQRAKDRRS